MVKLVPTVNCLVSLSEQPFFVMPISDIEVAHFERVHLQLRNFDLTFVMKDYTTFKRISTIGSECFEQLKEWLDQTDILYSEGMMPLNWNTILGQIRDDFGKFIEEGGWNFLHGAGDSQEDGESSMDEDSNF
jgi:nucleosome binding factor SPN SPT16 subunit